MGAIIYNVIGIFSLFCAFCEFLFRNCNKKLTFHRQLYIFLSIFLILFSGLRIDCGLDFSSYTDIYYKVHNGFNFLECQVEPLYWLLNYLCPTPEMLFFCMALLSCGPILYLFYKYSINKFLCLFLFYCTSFVYYNMGIIREGVAITIILCSLKYISVGKYKKFIFLVFIAEMFHMTALAAFPIIFFAGKKFKLPTYIVTILILIFTSLVYPNFVFKIIGLVSGKFALAAYKFNAYTTYLYSTGNTFGSNLYRAGLTLFFLILFFMYIPKQKKYFNNNETISWTYMNSYFIATLEFLVLSSMPYFSTRFSAILYYSFFFIYDVLVSKKVNKWIRLFVFILAITTAFRTFENTIYNSSGNVYIPYKTWILNF